ncbi:MAG: septal ring lytic transglycosylase RlpA family protein [Bacteroidales bacterium]|nr:septal ring lytic transglycosylase RlpA family protein [Bacteroidales bacterium]
MVVRKSIAILVVLTAVATRLPAQTFDTGDTTTEYNHKGTFYHNKFEGRKTASGEVFDQNLFTAAHWKIKLGTYVLVTNRNTGLQVIVKINDRCPKHGVLDMSRRAAHAIGIRGSQPVSLRILPPGYEVTCTRQDEKFDSVPSRFASGEYALSNSKNWQNHIASAPTKDIKENAATQAGKTTTATSTEKKQAPMPAKKTATTATQPEPRFNLLIGNARSHGNAFEMIERLPDPYKDKAVVDPSDDSTLTVILEVKLPEKKAMELTRALKHTFKDCHLAPAE